MNVRFSSFGLPRFLSRSFMESPSSFYEYSDAFRHSIENPGEAPDGNSRHNCNKPKNMFTKHDIADDIALQAGSAWIDPFGKYSPRDGLRNCDMCSDGGGQLV